jgi:D-sedoheptulose 7-phosphate isomerase
MKSTEPRDGSCIVQRVLDEAIAVHQRVRHGSVAPVARAAAAIASAFRAGCKVLAFGNGGSAADAQHFVSELVGRFQRDRMAFAAIALSTDSSVLTSVANDYGFERVFARQIEALGKEGDIAVAISTSGESPNVVAAIGAAKRCGLQTIALTGRSGGSVGGTVDIHINVPDASAARIQEVHTTLIHAICEIVETSM